MKLRQYENMEDVKCHLFEDEAPTLAFVWNLIYLDTVRIKIQPRNGKNFFSNKSSLKKQSDHLHSTIIEFEVKL